MCTITLTFRECRACDARYFVGQFPERPCGSFLEAQAKARREQQEDHSESREVEEVPCPWGRDFEDITIEYLDACGLCSSRIRRTLSL